MSCLLQQTDTLGSEELLNLTMYLFKVIIPDRFTPTHLLVLNLPMFPVVPMPLLRSGSRLPHHSQEHQFSTLLQDPNTSL